MSIDLPHSGLSLAQVEGVFALCSTGRFNEALDAVSVLLRNHSGEGILHNLAGLIHAAMRQYEPAIENLQRAIEIEPDVPEAHSKLCDGVERGNRIEAMAEALARARRHCPGAHPALVLREAEP